MSKAVRFSCILISLLLVTSNTYAATKAGSACAKLGSKSLSGGKSYTCVKSGKKLVWDKGVVLPPVKPVGSVTSAKLFTPWSTTASGDEISEAAQSSFRAWAALQPKVNPRHTLIMQEGVPAERAANFSAADRLGSSLFTQSLSQNSVTVIGANEDWVVGKLRENGGVYNDCRYSSGIRGVSFCLDGGSTQGFVVNSDARFQPTSLGADGTSLLTHEFFHIVQYQMANILKKPVSKDGSTLSKNLFPVWIIEGSANFVGFSVAALAMGSTYQESRRAMFNYAPQDPSLNRNALVDYEIRNGPGNYSPTYPYIAGQVATEYLVASVGFQKMLDIFTNFKLTGDFETSFKNAIGISKEDFYAKFEKVRTNLGLPEVSWKLVCLTNIPISELPTSSQECPLTDKTNTQHKENVTPDSAAPPKVDRNSNLENQGCTYGEAAISNSFGTFTCSTTANGNNMWKRTS